MSKKQKLELTWVGKENRPRLEPRIIIEDPTKSYHATKRVTDNDIFENVLIHGDNLLALKALEAEYTGKVKCVFIDPPYNTGSAFTHYDDGLEHSIWLGLMRDRLEIIRRLLSDDGSLWVTLDDNEAHYFKVMCDEIFGRGNFVTSVVWQKKYAPKSDSKLLSSSHDFVLVYSKNIDLVRLNRLEKTETQTGRYTNRDNDPRGPWKAGDVLRNEVRDYAVFPITTPSGREVWPSAGTSWRYTKEKFAELIEDNRVWFGVNGDARPAIKRFISDVSDTIPATTWWDFKDAGHNDEAKKESKELFGANVFGTPKPERLLQRVVAIATSPGDLILDSFAGSGTTGAVAHKMGRRWIMVELGNHCTTHIVPRLQKVIDGSDQGGISRTVDWKGGGGFRYYNLASSLLEKDKWGREVISHKYDAAMLAQALCKLEGFTYAPSADIWWQQGHSSETDFLYVTTQTLGPEELAALSDDVGEGRSLLVLCAAWRGNANQFSNLTLRKIPNHIRSKCEWGKDSYSLNVADLPMAEVEPARPQPAQRSLFDGERDE